MEHLAQLGLSLHYAPGVWWAEGTGQCEVGLQNHAGK